LILRANIRVFKFNTHGFIENISMECKLSKEFFQKNAQKA
jgi:hypothetical protein